MINIEITLVFAACENIFRVIFSALIYDSKVLRKILHSYLPYLEMFLLPLLLFFFVIRLSLLEATKEIQNTK